MQWAIASPNAVGRDTSTEEKKSLPKSPSIKLEAVFSSLGSQPYIGDVFRPLFCLHDGLESNRVPRKNYFETSHTFASCENRLD